MTCIAGVSHDGKVWIGADSAGVSGWSLRVRADEKVFRNGPFIMGFTTSFRMGQLLRYSLNPPEQTEKDDHAYLCTAFVDAVRECLKSGGVATREKEAEAGGDFLLGYRGSLYHVAEDYQVARAAGGIDAVGCGRDVAIGALAATPKATPRKRVLGALRAAEEFNAGVRGPFKVLSV